MRNIVFRRFPDDHALVLRLEAENVFMLKDFAKFNKVYLCNRDSDLIPDYQAQKKRINQTLPHQNYRL